MGGCTTSDTLCAKINYSCLLHQILMTSIIPQDGSSILLSIGTCTINTTIAKPESTPGHYTFCVLLVRNAQYIPYSCLLSSFKVYRRKFLSIILKKDFQDLNILASQGIGLRIYR